MNTINVKVEEVKVGAVIFREGFQWVVLDNEFDPRGNTGNQPRHILSCKAAHKEDYAKLGGYADSMSFGVLVGTEVTVVQ